MKPMLSWLRPYIISVLAVLVAFLTKVVVQPYLNISPPFITFLAAIMFVAWRWGFKPAAFATLVSAIMIDYSLIPPIGSLGLGFGDFASVLLFGFIGTGMAYAIHHLQSERHDAVALQRQLEHLHRLSSRLFEERDLEQTLKGILTAGMELLDAEKGTVELYDREDHNLHLSVQIGFDEDFLRRFHVVPPDASIGSAAVQRRSRVIIENVSLDTEFSALRHLFANYNVVSVQSTPFCGTGGRVLGVLTTYSSRAQAPSTRQFHLFDLFAYQAARIFEATQREHGLAQDKAELEEQVASTEDRLLKTISELAITEERERRQLSLELHDSLAQLLSFAKMKVYLAGRSLGTSIDKAERYIQETEQVLDRSLHYTRTLMAEFDPPNFEQLGLAAAIAWLQDRMRQHDLVVTLHIDCNPILLPHDQVVLLYRCIRELLMNIVKHAKVHRASVSLSANAEDMLEVVVHDDGPGFRAEAQQARAPGHHFGLHSIQERMEAVGGQFKILSAVGHGCTATLLLPMHEAIALRDCPAAEAHGFDRMTEVPAGNPNQEGLPFSS